MISILLAELHYRFCVLSLGGAAERQERDRERERESASRHAPPTSLISESSATTASRIAPRQRKSSRR